MRRKRKGRRTPIPEVTFLNLEVGYICPHCKRKVSRTLPFVQEDKATILQTAAWWCQFQFCSARHRVQYTVGHKEGKKPSLKIENFTSNDEVFNKRFQVLEWSGMESVTKKDK